MKDIRPALRSFLLADTAISAVVVDRVFPIKIPQGVNTASIVYTRVSGQGDYTMAGPSGLASPRYQIDCWAPTSDAATALAALVKARLDGYIGPIGSGASVVNVQGVFVRGEHEDYDDMAKLHRFGRDFEIWHEEL